MEGNDLGLKDIKFWDKFMHKLKFFFCFFFSSCLAMINQDELKLMNIT